MSNGEDGRLVAGRYRLLSIVGRGGMGIVWRAEDEVLGRQVAVKEVLPRPELSDGEREERHSRTLREARASARIEHASVVTVHDVVDEDDRPWIVMELVRARSLQEIVESDGPLDPGAAAGIGLQVVAALRAAHSIGILHRDVKPANVLITDEGRAVLTDFGIAQVAGDASLTQTGALIGSPAYMSPERVRGDGAMPASDLWALGATLYVACEAKPPHHRGDMMAVLAAILTQDPIPPQNAGELSPVLYGLLQRDPAERLNAEQAEEMLGEIAAGHRLAAGVKRNVTRHDQGRAPEKAPERAVRSVSAGGENTHDVPAPAISTVPPGEPPRGGRASLMLLVAVATVVMLVIVGAFLLPFWLFDESDDPRSPGLTASGAPEPAEAKTQPPQPSTRPSSPPSPRFGATARRRGPGGFTINVPLGWTREERGASTFWNDPASSAYVQVDRTGWTGDPYRHWQVWERQVIANNTLPGYRRIGLARSRVIANNGRVFQAADLQFAWGGRQGIDRGVRAGGRSYAVLVAASQADWPAHRLTVKNVINSFRP